MNRDKHSMLDLRELFELLGFMSEPCSSTKIAVFRKIDN